MPGQNERLPPRDAARSVARDLVRLVRAVETGAGLDALSGLQRAQLDAVRRALVRVYHELAIHPTLTEEVSRLKAYLGATRDGILAQLTRDQRLSVLQALLAVEVGEPEVRALMALPRRSRPQVLSSARRAAARIGGEERRRREEARALDASAGVLEHFARLPAPWRMAIWRAAGFGGPPIAAGMARYLLDEDCLQALVQELRPGERAALTMVLRGGGLALAREVEERFGDSACDGYDWTRERPTSVLGRLRLQGLVSIGRLALPDNPRRRPRVVLVPRDLRLPLARALVAAPPLPGGTATVPASAVEEMLAHDQAPPRSLAVAEPLDHAQPELFRFVAVLSRRLSRRVRPTHLVRLVAGIWRCFEQAHPGRVPRLRDGEIEAARLAALDDLAAVETTHLRLLQRRVVRMLSAQPHLYAYIANLLEVATWAEADKLVVFHGCDVAVRALHQALSTG
jgi:hypothetical protein